MDLVGEPRQGKLCETSLYFFSMKTKPVKMWAWWDAKDKQFWHIYPNIHCVQICSPDGFEAATKRGDGKITRVEVRPVRTKRKI